MLAKALAKESGATFINLSVSTLTNKWYGESNKLVHAVFSLARRISPAIIFVDEIDCFLRERGRGGGDHEVTGMMKAEWMTQWDGLLTDPNTQILVLGATNRPNDIDPAILRRMPKKFAIRLPGFEQRKKILGIMLRNTELSETVSLDLLAVQTDGCSGSDLHELCRNAAMQPLKELMRREGGLEGLKSRSEIPQADGDALLRNGGEDFKLRPLTLRDFATVDGDGLPPVGTNDPVPLSKGLPVKQERREEGVLEFDD
jgi:SpoVK/Ycf46/Vps4 family AAA+-type ATPase